MTVSPRTWGENSIGEIAAVWGLALALFLEWESERLGPDEITAGVIVTIVGAFLTRMVAIARGLKGWPYV